MESEESKPVEGMGGMERSDTIEKVGGQYRRRSPGSRVDQKKEVGPGDTGEVLSYKRRRSLGHRGSTLVEYKGPGQLHRDQDP